MHSGQKVVSLQIVGRWFLDADVNLDSHQKPNYYFLAIYNVP